MLKERESGVPTAEVRRKRGISSASFDKDKAKYGGMDVSDARKLKALEERMPSSRSCRPRRDGYVVGRRRVRRLMDKTGLEAIYKRPGTGQPHPQHSIYPYLLRGMAINRPNQVWTSDITSIPV